MAPMYVVSARSRGDSQWHTVSMGQGYYKRHRDKYLKAREDAKEIKFTIIDSNNPRRHYITQTGTSSWTPTK